MKRDKSIAWHRADPSSLDLKGTKAAIVREQFVNGRPLERLVNRDAFALRKEIGENRAKAMAALRAQQGGRQA